MIRGCTSITWTWRGEGGSAKSPRGNCLRSFLSKIGNVFRIYFSIAHKLAADFVFIPTVVSQLKHQPNNLLASRLVTTHFIFLNGWIQGIGVLKNLELNGSSKKSGWKK